MNSKSTTLWAARDKNGSLWLYTEKPIPIGSLFIEDVDIETKNMEICSSLLPEITWENSPKKVKLTIEELDMDGIENKERENSAQTLGDIANDNQNWEGEEDNEFFRHDGQFID